MQTQENKSDKLNFEQFKQQEQKAIKLIEQLKQQQVQQCSLSLSTDKSSPNDFDDEKQPPKTDFNRLIGCGG